MTKISAGDRFFFILAISFARVVVPSPPNSYKPCQDLLEATLLERTMSVQWFPRFFGTIRQTNIMLLYHKNRTAIYIFMFNECVHPRLYYLIYERSGNIKQTFAVLYIFFNLIIRVISASDSCCTQQLKKLSLSSYILHWSFCLFIYCEMFKILEAIW